MKVAVYRFPGSKRSELIASAMASGIKACGDDAILQEGINYKRPDADVAVFYGLLKKVMHEYMAEGKKAVYIDLGYWGRHEGGRRAGYHKIAVNSRHPTAYFQKFKHSSDRFDKFNVKIHPRRSAPNGYIMLAGMSAKAAHAEGYGPEQWERDVAHQMLQHTRREIVYRPKPNWHDARGVPGTRMLRGNDGDVETYLDNCHAVVTHHSNVSIDAVLYGVPTFCWDGVATLKGSSDLRNIETPFFDDDRAQWAYDLAYTQWNVAEMQKGAAWHHLKSEGIVP